MQQVTIRYYRYSYDYEKRFDNIKNLNFMKCCDLPILKEYEEFEKLIQPEYWKLDNCIIIIDTVKQNNVEHYIYIEQYVQIQNIEYLFHYCCSENLYNIVKYLYTNYIIHFKINGNINLESILLDASFKFGDYNIVKYILSKINNNIIRGWRERYASYKITYDLFYKLYKHKNIKLLLLVLEKVKCPKIIDLIIKDAIKNNFSIPMIQSLYNVGYRFTSEMYGYHSYSEINEAIYVKNIDMVKWLIAHKCKIQDSIAFAIRYDHYNIVKLLVNNGGYVSAKSTNILLQYKNYSLLQYLNDNSSHKIYYNMEQLILLNNTKLFLWIIGYNYTKNMPLEDMLQCNNGNLIKFNPSKVHGFNERDLSAAIFINNFDIARWLHGYKNIDYYGDEYKNNEWKFDRNARICKFSTLSFFAAAKNGSMELFEWVEQHDCPYNSNIVQYITRKGRLDKLLYLRGYRKIIRELSDEEINDNTFLKFKDNFTEEEYEWVKYAKLVKESKVYEFEETSLEEAMVYGNINIIKWIMEILFEIYPTYERSKHIFAVSTHMETLEISKILLTRYGCPYSKKAIKKVIKRNPDIEWLRDYE